MQSCPKIVRENRTNSGLWLALNRRVTLQSSPLVQSVIASAIDVHAALGPGLLESSYRQCIAREFDLRAIRFEAEVAIPLTYKGLRLDCGYRVDFVVDASLGRRAQGGRKSAPDPSCTDPDLPQVAQSEARPDPEFQRAQTGRRREEFLALEKGEEPLHGFMVIRSGQAHFTHLARYLAICSRSARKNAGGAVLMNCCP